MCDNLHSLLHKKLFICGPSKYLKKRDEILLQIKKESCGAEWCTIDEWI